MTNKRFLIALLTMLTLLLTLPAQAAVEAGRILFARGTVSIVDANDSARGGSVGSVFYEGDRVVTGNKSIVQLRLSDGALTALRSNSDYQIQRQRFDEPAQVYEQAGRLVAGWMRSVTGAIGAKYPGNVQQGTSVATIGIRGTTYQIIHVPPEGLPEFPNLQAGSYIYLEDGQIEVSNEAGRRIISPGQVVRITSTKVAPELMPDLVELFQSQLLSSLEIDDREGFGVRDLLDGKQDPIIDAAIRVIPVPFSGSVAGVGAFGGSSGQAGRVSSSNLLWTGAGASRYVEAMIIDAQDGVSTTPYDLSENGSGSVSGTQYRQIRGANGLAAQIHWGLWTAGHFDALDAGGFPVSDTGIWHYMFADNVLENGANQISALGLTGRYAYNYIGGTELNVLDSDGLPTAGLTAIDSGRIIVDFGDLSMNVDMSFDNGSDLFRLIGSGNVDAFYNAGIGMSATVGGPISASGRIGGSFVGAQAEGIISALTVQDFTNSLSYYGTAAFQRESTLANVVGGITALDFDSSRLRAHLPSWSMETGGTGTGTFLQSAVIPGPSVDIYEASAIGATPAFQDHATVFSSGDSVEVYWGIWDVPTAPQPASYEVINVDTGAPGVPVGGWHYMIADNVLTASNVVALGLTGTVTYNYGGGTLLENPQSGMTTAIEAASAINVNFDDLFGASGIAVSLAVDGTTLSGQGDVGMLYSSSGIALSDGSAFGSISGAFAGNQAQALVTGVDYNDGINESYYGTALFRKNIILTEP